MSVALPILGLHTNQRAAATAPPAAPSQASLPGRLIDSHRRTIRDLRLSVTDRCNFRCIYCMDPDFRYMPKQQLLSLEEYLTVVRVCLSLGIEKVRITGGEPTLYPQLDELIAALGRMGVRDMALTTNGSLLRNLPLDQWRRDGLHRITLSLDSLRPQRVQAITRTNSTAQSVIDAIKVAQQAGFVPIKVNAVIMRGINDDEVSDFADFAIEHNIDMRLIEFMPLDSSRAWSRNNVVGADEMLERIRARHELIPVEDDDPSSTSMNFRFAACMTEPQRPGMAMPGRLRADRAEPRIGIIAPVTRPFCGACSRLRITADGKIRPCLFSLSEWDLRPLLRDGASDDDVRAFIIDAVWTKQAGHGIGSKTFIQPQRTMSAIGG
ncbi:MAG: GTP 3',8-cyclase MoaA [Phycisphaerales bacterium]|nr:GTP 3',8-cyclase MoaA [Phycisphaerales bacterium]MCI0629807.1 GTP 3',8-cyclase MoaA [Phycisphaerales bacterium]MCI0674689.1 GTP 3',8-cyclase MoaA [Phycisphaerales bacterium]